ncbi:MAG: MarR family transcriptional regulator [Geminicoccaceae bacterium]
MELNTIPGHMIRRLHQMSTHVFQTRMREAGVDLTPVQFAALHAISVKPGIDQATIAATIAYDRATIGGVIDRLEAKGLVERKVSRRDRRAREVGLSEAGRALLDRVRPIVDDLQGDILSGLDGDEQAMLLRLCRKALGIGGVADCSDIL